MASSLGVKLVEVEHISGVWKVLHILFLVLAALFGICGGTALSLLYEEDDFLCGAVSLISSTTSDPGKTEVFMNGSYISLDVLPLGGAADDACEFSEYTLITSFIFAAIWMVFFMMCGRGGKSDGGLSQPWRIVLPALIFSSIFFFISLGAGAQTTAAINTFCINFDEELARIRNENETVTEKCRDLDLFLQVQHVKFLKVQSLMQIAEAMAWLCVSSWGCSAGLCLLRMLTGPDFRPVLIPGNEVDAPRARAGDGYRSLGSPSSSSESSPGERRAPVAGTSQAEVHAVAEKRDMAIQTHSVPVSSATKDNQLVPQETSQAVCEPSCVGDAMARGDASPEARIIRFNDDLTDKSAIIDEEESKPSGLHDYFKSSH